MGSGLSQREVAEVYQRYGHLIARRCRVVLRDAALAEDALQETFVKVMRYGAQLRQADSKLRWLYRVADRCCFDLLRRRSRVVAVPLPAGDDGGPPEELRIESRDLVLRTLSRLSDRDKQIAVLAFVDGLSQGEIAAELQLSRQTINKRLGRIRSGASRLAAKGRG